MKHINWGQAFAEDAYWSLELVNRIAIKNVTLDDAASHVIFSLEWLDRIVPLIDASRSADRTLGRPDT